MFFGEGTFKIILEKLSIFEEVGSPQMSFFYLDLIWDINQKLLYGTLYMHI